MDQIYAIIQNNIVINVVVWNGDTNTWQPPEGTIAVPVGDSGAGIGWTYDPATGEFTPPPQPDPIPDPQPDPVP